MYNGVPTDDDNTGSGGGEEAKDTVRFNIKKFWNILVRTKKLDTDGLSTSLKRCLTTVDLALLGIGNMTGAGIYVLTGAVVRRKAGPFTWMSFLIAGITAFLNGLCYAELGARIPKAGSAYSYTYIAAGEFLAFIIGWSVILEYVLSAASVARGWSSQMGSIIEFSFPNSTLVFASSHTNNMNINVTASLAENGTSNNKVSLSNAEIHLDYVGFSLVICMSLILLLGPRMSASFNSVITSINVTVILFTTCIMFYYGDVANWNLSQGAAGVMPFGFGGVVAGASTCFYAFIGFDAISIAGEEAVSPRQSLPRATISAVGFVAVLLVLSSASLTLFIPWQEVDVNAAFTSAMIRRNLIWPSYITAVGALMGITAALFCSIYAIPRVVYAMALDGLIFKTFCYVLPSTQVPAWAIIVFNMVAAFFTLFFNIETLADFLSIGTLIAYTIVAVNVIVLRYISPKVGERHDAPLPNGLDIGADGVDPRDREKAQKTPGTLKRRFANVPLLNRLPPGRAAAIALALFLVLTTTAILIGVYSPTGSLKSMGWSMGTVVVLSVGAFASGCVLYVHQEHFSFESFKLPFMPWTPCVCIVLNIILIAKLPPVTWIRFTLWLLIGFTIYFSYGIFNSTERNAENAEADSFLAGGLLQKNDDNMPKLDGKLQLPQPQVEALPTD